jgi:hypothetical protein
MSATEQKDIPLAVRASACLLIISAVLGIYLAAYGAANIVKLGLLLPLGFPSAFVASLFAISVWNIMKGIDLWKGKPKGYMWGKILFGLQTPIVCVPGFWYEYSPVLNIRLLLDPAGMGITYAPGPTFGLRFSQDMQCTTIGINLVALAALIYLVSISRPNKPLEPTW